MDYEKKYKEALEWMRDIYFTLSGATKEDAEHFFPELAESEDERIRKAILKAVEDNILCYEFVDKKDMIAWLEKQKAVDIESIKTEFYNAGYEDGKENMQEPVGWSEEDKLNLQGIIDEIEANKNTAPSYDIPTYDRFLSWLKSLHPQPKQDDRYMEGYMKGLNEHWKPSDEQMMYLAAAVEESNENPVLDSLYNDLKKL